MRLWRKDVQNFYMCVFSGSTLTFLLTKLPNNNPQSSVFLNIIIFVQNHWPDASSNGTLEKLLSKILFQISKSQFTYSKCISPRTCQQDVVSAQFMFVGCFRPNGRLRGKSPLSPGK